MHNQVEVTVFPRLDCCVPDFTGKNAVLAEVLRQARDRLADRAAIVVMPTADRLQRYAYYRKMVEALVAEGYDLPFARDPDRLAEMKRQLDTLETGLIPGSGTIRNMKQISAFLFMIPPVVAIQGKAVFVGDVPSAAQLCEAVVRASEAKEGLT